jgi:hypothetical protein
MTVGGTAPSEEPTVDEDGAGAGVAFGATSTRGVAATATTAPTIKTPASKRSTILQR